MNVNMIGISRDYLTHCDWHMHSQWEIVICLCGSGILRVGNQDILFTTGTIVCQPPNIPHSLSNAENYKDMFVTIENFIPLCTDTVPIFHDDEGGRFLNLAMVLYESFYRNEPNREVIVNGLWDVMYQLLSGWSESSIRNMAVKKMVRDMILNISNVNFDISKHINGNGYSVDHLRRCFKREMGQTPTAYMIHLRLEHACKLLDLPQQGGYTIKQIAWLSGFSDPYYFSNTFKKHIGCSPTEYIGNKHME